MIDNSKRTCYQHFSELYTEDRERASHNAYVNESHEDGILYDSLEVALAFAFDWENSPEGYIYWAEVFNALEHGTYDQLRADQKKDEYFWTDEDELTEAGMEALADWMKFEEDTKVLPLDAAERKTYPIYSGFIKNFPNAIACVSKLSYEGSKQHHPDAPVHWDMSKSSDELDAMMRHMLDGEWDAVAWRALANLERKLTGNCQYED